MAEIQEEPGGSYVLATECSICERPIPPDAIYALCPRCEGTSRAHARLERDRIEYEREDGPNA